MDVFLLGAGRPATGKRPSALKLISYNKNAIDWQIHSFEVINNLRNIHFLGGYNVDEVIEYYPQLNFTVIPDWKEKSILHTFLKAPFFDNEILVTYSDTVFRQDAISNMLKIDADVVFCIDSCWKNRYQPRAEIDINSAETIQIKDSKGKLKDAEFTGLVHFKKTAIKLISALKEEDIGTTLIDLIDYLKSQALSVKYFDVTGDWAELNSSNDIARFILGTKAETLARLEPLVKKSHINKQINFTAHDWSTKSDLILKKIKKNFFGASLVVRSSSKREDSWQLSNAGKFESFLNIKVEDPIAIRKAIESVISSYGEKHYQEDQVLVQEFLKKTNSSGVLFTCSLETGAPYYHFNFDDKTHSTNSVTSGVKGDLRTIVVSKLKSEYLKEVEPQMICVLEAVQELEQLLGYDRLDIEFGVDLGGKVHIFQVRPITLDHSDFDNNLKAIKKSLEDNVLQFDNEQGPKPFLYGDKTIFANMPDWNPAEIIGKKPKPLAFSLYRHLITNDIWAQQRYEFGYKDVRPYPLIMSFSGQPYVDTRVSFNSFLPKDLPENISKKLVNSYIDILERNPKLHDKIEFEIAFTVWFPSFYSHAIKRLSCYGFTDNEILILENSLKKITRNALVRLNNDTFSIKQLVRRRSAIEASNTSDMDKIFSLLDDCKRFGTLAFAHAARAGFVAKTLLKSFVEADILSSERISEFMRSVKTVAGEFEDDKEQYHLGHLPMRKLIEKYGHLRPGTYDICAEAYWENTKKYFFTDKTTYSEHSIKFNITKNESKNLSGFLKELGSSISPNETIEYLYHAIQLRESVKFEFTKNLSKALDLLVKLADELNLTRNDISFLEYDDLKQLRLNVIKTEELKDIIEKNRNKFCISQLIDLPSFINESKYFYSFEKHSSQPNFITNSKIHGNIVLLSENTANSLEEAVVLISQADPGFDWLFGYNIGGLITQFGGANSHMAIRAAEIGLPAAIGVGEKLYEQISKMKRIELDCNNQIIRELL